MPIPKRELDRISGFPELAPHEAIEQQRILDVIRRHYERAGFTPLESPLVERTTVLSAKSSGEINTQMYGLRLLNPQKSEGNPGEAPDDEKNLGVRFDHTVQLARYVASKAGEIRFPFKRYTIGAVMRGEKAKKSRHRSRQFTQADIDVVGDRKLHLLHDAEMVDVIVRIFEDLRVGPFTFRINNRKILDGILRARGLDTDDKVKAARNAIDEIDKIGFDAVASMLGGVGLEDASARELLDLLKRPRPVDETMNALSSMDLDAGFKLGAQELDAVVRGVRQMGVPEQHYTVDLSLARALDYYTGTIYELFMQSHPLISVAGGGRYEELASEFTNRSLPGVGISIGVTRLLHALLEARKQQFPVSTVAPVLIATGFGVDAHGELFFSVTRELRNAGIGVEVYIEPRKAEDQVAFALKRGFKVAIEVTDNDHSQGTLMVHNLRKGGRESVARSSIVEAVKNVLRP